MYLNKINLHWQKFTLGSALPDYSRLLIRVICLILQNRKIENNAISYFPFWGKVQSLLIHGSITLEKPQKIYQSMSNYGCFSWDMPYFLPYFLAKYIGYIRVSAFPSFLFFHTNIFRTPQKITSSAFPD